MDPGSALHTNRIQKETGESKVEKLITMMEWKNITDLNQVSDIKSAKGYSLIFKHSTRCSVSSMVKRRFELDWDIIPAETNLYFLDLISYRALSAQIADAFAVAHESPQLLLIKDGECIMDTSHGDISADEVAELIISE